VTKQRLMLSAAAGALLASGLSLSLARADTEISNSTGTALNTASSGNIVIDTSGSVGAKGTTATVLLNSNNFVYNAGSISNDDTASAIGLEVDTSAGNIVSQSATSSTTTATTSAGLANLGTIDLTGTGTGKAAILITGGNTFFGPVTLSSVATLVTTGNTTQTVLGGSTVSVQGDSSSAFYLVQGTKIDGDVSFGGSMTMVPTNTNQSSPSVLANFDGTLNGNLLIDPTSTLTNIGSGARGLQILGGIHGCDSAAESGAGLTCPATSIGSFINAGTISVIGTQYIDPKKTNPEAGSALVIGSSIDGGFVNEGPATSNATTGAATIASNGLAGSATLLIDPSQAVDASTGAIRGPIVMGPVQSQTDSVDPGYSFINRGTITAAPSDGQTSAQAVDIVGSSTTNYTCLSSTVASCSTAVQSNGYGGGLLNTGTISAGAGTIQQTNTNGAVSAIALTIGAYATVPRIDVAGEITSGSATTPGAISASVSGEGQGQAFAIFIDQNANVPTIDVKAHGSITASVTTSTVSPDASIAPSASPFTLQSEAIGDQSGTLTTINNAGLIAALNTQLTPAVGAVVVYSARAIDLVASNASGIQINNSGTIEGDVLFGSVGNNDVLNVGNVGGSGTAANPITGQLNSPNQYAVVAATSIVEASGLAPVTTPNVISFGTGSGQQLNIGSFGYVNSVILAGEGGLDVNLYNNGTLFIANTEVTGAVNAHDFNIQGGTLGLTLSQQSGGSVPLVAASDAAYIAPTAKLGLQFGSFVSSGTTAESVNNPVPQSIVLVTAPAGALTIDPSTLQADNVALASNIPFLFQPTSTPLSKTTIGGKDALVVTLTPKSPTQLGLTGDAAAVFPSAAAALVNDPALGSAIAGGITSSQTAQNAFSQFGPDVSGGIRQIAILITDQETGPVAARQRLLRSYADQPGEMTLWGEEFAGSINNKGRTDADGSLTNYKDHGFGFAVGMDSGSPRGGWYGGALSFYSGDVIETLPRASKTNTQWYMLTGYTDWRGRHVFLDTQGSLAYGSLLGHRDLIICGGTEITCQTPIYERQADSKRAGLLGALGATTGVILHWGGMEVTPHIGLDAMSLREDGYTEYGGGDGMNLQVAPYYANSLRTSVGTDLKANITIWDFTLSPEARLGYRYDFINSPVRLKAAFDSTGGTAATGNTLTFVGPDPDTGNVVGGLSLGASTDSWHVGVNYDWIRGNNGSTSQIATVSVLGRI
jgi:hypothetical protein